MRVRVSQPHLLPDLFEFLKRRANVVVQRVGDDEIAVGVLGSFADGGVRELSGYLEDWQAERLMGGLTDDGSDGRRLVVVQ
jgi:hypothetical protein